MSGYDALADLAELELEIVSAGALERLPALRAERSALITSLPNLPPPEARPALERAATFQARVTLALETRIQSTGSDLRRLTHGRSAMRGYAPRVDHTKLVDQAG